MSSAAVFKSVELGKYVASADFVLFYQVINIISLWQLSALSDRTLRIIFDFRAGVNKESP